MTCFPSARPAMEEYCYTVDEVVKVLRTGDLIFESGKTPVSNVVKAGTGSMWSHIAIVYKDKIFEAVRYDDTHITDGKKTSGNIGCRLRDIRDYFSTYNGTSIAVRHLLVREANIDVEKFQSFVEKKMKKTVKRIKGAAYNSDPFTILCARADCKILLPPDNGTSYFCSSLVAKCFKDIGLLDKDATVFSFFPDDFTKEHFPLLRPAGVPLTSVFGLSDNNSDVIQLGKISYVYIPNDNERKRKSNKEILS